MAAMTSTTSKIVPKKPSPNAAIIAFLPVSLDDSDAALGKRLNVCV